MGLVDVVDELLALLEADERLRFTLDGQLATVDDYLEIRPEGEHRIRALVQEGRLVIGPWQTLPDEFLVSGESLIRNLETGLARAAELGGAMRVGYLPDSFGHVAQMPQILRGAGIDTAVVWRGVPAAVDSHVFTWSAPDGSSVRAEYLPEGYGNAAHVFDGPDAARELGALADRLRPWFGDDPVLAMVGTDHMPPVRDLAKRLPDGAQIGTIADYLARSAHQAAPHWHGELRSGARANLLPNVVSARIDIKAACARAERALERYAEPLQALYGDVWPEKYLEEAWRRVLQNAAHDSICGCSADDVSAQVLVRYAEAHQIGRELAQRAVERIAAGAPAESVVVVNPSPWERTDLIELELPVPAEWEAVALELPDRSLLPTQEIARQDPLLWEGRYTSIESVRHRVHGREVFGRSLNGVRIEEQTVTLDVGVEPDPEWLDVEELLREIDLATAEGEWKLRIEARPRRTLLASVSAPPLGWTSVRPVHAAGRATNTETQRAWNDLDFRNIARIVRGVDLGDSYTYAKAPDDALVDAPEDERLEMFEAGPLRWIAVLHRTYRWSGREVSTETRFEMRLDEAFVRVRISFDNPCNDQRVRVHVPLPEPAASTRAEGQFAVVERPPRPEGGYGEKPVGTYPASAFVAAGGLALLLDHVTEYELVAGGREVALTVLRSVGLLSRSANAYREDPAGPELPIPAAQMRGAWTFSFAICNDAEEAPAAAEAYRHPFLTGAGFARSSTTREQAGPELSGAMLASLRRRGGRLEARVVNESDAPTTVRGVMLRPWEIRTLLLD